MNPTTLFYILIAILIVNFIIDKVLDILNSRHFDDVIPSELEDVYEKEEYEKSQAYKKTNAQFSTITGLFSLVLTLVFFFFDGFKYVDEIARSYSSNTILITLIFFGIILIGSDLINTPFSIYKTFVIEEKFGFNKTTKKTFVFDKIKGLLMTVVLGGGLLALIVWFYEFAGTSFWIYAWVVVAIFSVFMNMFYSKLIVP
ncbi:MAG: M48 family peptidase, partial [Flavobacteriaceae bacterium]|nr:M48 family peptidase [Flavobacteriaceae bacterium]